MGGNVSDSDVHRTQLKLVESLHKGFHHRCLNLDMAYMQGTRASNGFKRL